MTDRRRLNRRDRKALRHLNRQRAERARDDQRQAWERDVVARLLRRFVPHEDRVPLHHDFRYWSCRRAGWDVLHTRWRGHLPAEASPVWVWWSELHWKQREAAGGLRRREVRRKTEPLNWDSKVLVVVLENPIIAEVYVDGIPEDSPQPAEGDGLRGGLE